MNRQTFSPNPRKRGKSHHHHSGWKENLWQLLILSWGGLNLCVRDTQSHHLIYPLTARVFGALQIVSQLVSSIFPCSPLSFGTWRTPDLSIPWCCLPTSSIVCLVFFPLSLCLARWFWPDLMNGKQDHTTAVAYAMKNIVDKACSLVNECYLCTTVSNLVNTTGEFKYRKPLQSQFIARF